MNKFFITLFILLCIAAFALPVNAASKEGQGVRAGITIAPGENGNQHQEGNRERTNRYTTTIRETQQENRTEIKGTGQGSAHNASTLRSDIHQQREQFNATHLNGTAAGSSWNGNENQVRLAVHTLLAMENYTGGIGRNVSAIAREFNNSVNAGRHFEERIQNRDLFSRFFFGGDRDAAGALADLTLQNQARIGQIEDLMNSTTLDADTRSIMDEQLLALTEEQARLAQLVSREQQNHGFFG